MRDGKGGGMGVKNLKMHNKSLIFKWLWKYNSEDQAFWKKIIEAVYGKRDGWRPCPETHIRLREDGFGKTLAGCGLSLSHIKIEVGNAEDIRLC